MRLPDAKRAERKASEDNSVDGILVLGSALGQLATRKQRWQRCFRFSLLFPSKAARSWPLPLHLCTCALVLLCSCVVVLVFGCLLGIPG